MHFDLIPTSDHCFDVGQRCGAGSGKVHVHDDECGEESCNQSVHRRQNRHVSCQLSPTAGAPHQQTRDDLERKQDVENREVSDLL